ncbi:hypothetical protein HDU96_005858 [Phlyctochytrium bullatum]|nr:hypothetical protein HDU96_005858 [Phlyctochytrium bullatum]
MSEFRSRRHSIFLKRKQIKATAEMKDDATGSTDLAKPQCSVGFILHDMEPRRNSEKRAASGQDDHSDADGSVPVGIDAYVERRSSARDKMRRSSLKRPRTDGLERRTSVSLRPASDDFSLTGAGATRRPPSLNRPGRPGYAPYPMIRPGTPPVSSPLSSEYLTPGALVPHDYAQLNSKTSLPNSSVSLGSTRHPHSRELGDSMSSKIKELIRVAVVAIINGLLIYLAWAMKNGIVVLLPPESVQFGGAVFFEIILLISNLITIHAVDMSSCIYFAQLFTTARKGYSMVTFGYMHTMPLLRIRFAEQLSLNSKCRKLLHRLSFVWLFLELTKLLSPLCATGVSTAKVFTLAPPAGCVSFQPDDISNHGYPTVESNSGVAEFIFGKALGCMRSQEDCDGGRSIFVMAPQLLGAVGRGDTIEGQGYQAKIYADCKCYDMEAGLAVQRGLLTEADVRTFLEQQKTQPMAMVYHGSRRLNVTYRQYTDVLVLGNLHACGGTSALRVPVCTVTIGDMESVLARATFDTDGTTASIALVNTQALYTMGTGYYNASSLSFAFDAVLPRSEAVFLPQTVPGMMPTTLYWMSSNLLTIHPALLSPGLETTVAMFLRGGIMKTFSTTGESCPRFVSRTDQVKVKLTHWGYATLYAVGALQLLFTLLALGCAVYYMPWQTPISPAQRALQDPTYFMTLLMDSPFTINLVGIANAPPYVFWQSLDIMVKIGESIDTLGDPVGHVKMERSKADVRDQYTNGPPVAAPPAVSDSSVATPNDSMDIEPPKSNTIESLLPDIGLEVEQDLIYEWKIPSFNALKTQKKAYSPEFECGGSKWRVLLFPTGNQQQDTMSVFLDSIDAATAPKNSNWHICVQFALAIQNYEDKTIYKASSTECLPKKTTPAAQHRYNPNETDWGFNHLVKLSQLFTPIENFSRALIENDQTVITVYMKIIKDVTGVLWHNFINYDSKKETGFVGLKNQGATCYMNSLLQSLYFTTYFRKATYAIPTENDEPTKSIPLALQRVFYQLQHSDTPVGTTELTKSFGWDALDSFMQHDVQEFNRVLQDNLESKMKGTKAEGAISRLFVGKYKSYIKCINVDYESSRIEDFYDIQLNVKGCKNLHESFINYIAVETLDGDNKYQAEGHGLQDAKKGVIFTEFPPVLHMQLKRFEYDIERDAMVKINDRHEFPLEIDLAQFLDDSVPSKHKPQKYHLHGVLVHSGDLHGGHYCAFLRPEKDGKWFKFDDDRVIPVTDKEVFEENFGGEFPQPNGAVKPNFRNSKRFTNAYMLVYIRDSDLEEILSPLEETDIPEHLRKRLEEERLVSEQKRKEKEEQHLYLNVKVLLDEHIRQHPGFDLANFDEKAYPLTPLPTFKVKKEDTLASFKQLLSEKLNAPPERIKLWTMVGRQNRTVRPDSPLPDTENEKTMEAVKDRHIKAAPELRFYAEVTDGFQPPKPPEETANQIIIFLKYYDPVIQKMEYVGKMVIPHKASKIIEFIPQMLDRKGLPPNTPIKLYEEIKPGMIEQLKSKVSFQGAELGDGDIICFQKELTPQEVQELPDPSVAEIPQYFENLQNRQVVLFKPKQKDRETNRPEVELVLSKKMLYDVVVQKLGERLGSDPNKIRLSPNTAASAKQAIKRAPTLTLQEMLQTGYYTPMMAPTVLFYEELEVNLSELDFKRFLKVSFIDAHFKEVGPMDLLVMKTAKVSEVIDLVREKLKLPAGGSAPLRMYEVTAQYRIHRFFADDDLISTISEFSTLYVEEVPADELKPLGEGDKLINLAHYNREPARGHGVPFRVVIKGGEMFSVTKERIRTRMGMNDKDFAKAKFFIVPGGFSKPKPIEDGDILSDYDFRPNDFLGMDHVDRSGKTNRPGGVEKAIKIFN